MTMDQQLIQGITERLKVIECDIDAIRTEIEQMRDLMVERNTTLAELQQFQNTLNETLKTMQKLVSA